ncbi:MAG: DUF1802 family protein [Opitutaceae bacterium]
MLPSDSLPPTVPAFKEWQVITEALGSGEQTIILRKGGISEGRAGFQIEANRFWLFPTQFHAQREKTKPAAAKWFPPVGTTPAAPANITLRYFADIVQTSFLTRWEDVAALDPLHFWTEAAVREKFEWDQPPGLHALVVRIHCLNTPVTLPLTPDMGGCKSWIGVPCGFADTPSSPVLDDRAFASRLVEITRVLPLRQAH